MMQPAVLGPSPRMLSLEKMYRTRGMVGMMVLLILLETRRRRLSFLFNVPLFLILLGIECLLSGGCSGACFSGASLTEYVLISRSGSVEASLNREKSKRKNPFCVESEI